MRLFALLLPLAALARYLYFVAWVRDDDTRPKAPPSSLVSTASAWLALPALMALGVTLPLQGADLHASLILLVVGLALMGFALVLIMPLTLAVAIAVPLAKPKLAYRLARLSTIRSDPDSAGVAMAVAARAALRAPEPDRVALAWIVERIGARPLTPGMVLALGLIASATGNDEDARNHLELLDAFDDTITDPWITRWAHEWLALEAAERGDWLAVHRATHGLGRRTSLTRWLGAVAGRFLDRPDAPTEQSLDSQWQGFPGHRKVADLHDQALTYVHPQRGQHNPSLTPLEAHVQAIAHPSAETLSAAVRAWTNTPPIAPDVATDIVSDLQLAAKRAGVPLHLPKSGPLCPSESRGGDPLEDLEIASNRLAHRLGSKSKTDVLQDLRDWLELSQLLHGIRRQGDPQLLRLAFRPVYSPLCALSVSLFNDRNEPHLSNALTRWLLFLAQEVGDTPAIALQTQNLAATRRRR